MKLALSQWFTMKSSSSTDSQSVSSSSISRIDCLIASRFAFGMDSEVIVILRTNPLRLARSIHALLVILPLQHSTQLSKLNGLRDNRTLELTLALLERIHLLVCSANVLAQILDMNAITLALLGHRIQRRLQCSTIRRSIRHSFSLVLLVLTLAHYAISLCELCIVPQMVFLVKPFARTGHLPHHDESYCTPCIRCDGV